MTNPTLVMLVGCAGSGKSTLAEKLFPNHVRLSTDRFIEAFAADFGKTYNEVFKDHYKTAEAAMYADLSDAIAKGLNIIWDQTNLTPATRKKKLDKIPPHYTKIALCVECQWTDLCNRNEERKKFGRSLPYDTLENMWNTMVSPMKKEGFDYVLSNIVSI